MTHKREGLYLWDYNSMVCVHFCLLESLTLWPICALSSCICGSVREEERKASRLALSRSVRSGVMLGMRPSEMWCFAKMLRILRNWCSPVLQEEGNPKRENDFFVSGVYESQSALLRLIKVQSGGSFGNNFPVWQ